MSLSASFLPETASPMHPSVSCTDAMASPSFDQPKALRRYVIQLTTQYLRTEIGAQFPYKRLQVPVHELVLAALAAILRASRVTSGGALRGTTSGLPKLSHNGATFLQLHIRVLGACAELPKQRKSRRLTEQTNTRQILPLAITAWRIHQTNCSNPWYRSTYSALATTLLKSLTIP